jgi:hypothetical protein
MKPRGILRERIMRVLLVEPDGLLIKYKLSKKAECSQWGELKIYD